MPENMPQMWAVLLIAATAVSLLFTLRRINDGGIPATLAAGAVLFRVGLLFIGVVYATGLVHRSRVAVLAGFGVAAAGAVLNLISAVAGMVEGRRHRRGRRRQAADAAPDRPEDAREEIP